MFHKILVVCVGNICRSPTAQLLLASRLPGKEVSSAGLGALVGEGMEPTALAVAGEHGLDGTRHVARQLDEAMIRAADLILVMEQSHVDRIGRESPHAVGKTMLLGKWIGNRGIPDPYRQARPAFEHVYELMERAVTAWVPYLRAAA